MMAAVGRGVQGRDERPAGAPLTPRPSAPGCGVPNFILTGASAIIDGMTGVGAGHPARGSH